ncbi:uncharacterized protein LOC115222996 [Octopus sinensis]|uniref:Uncharacterized protein LOC115222996 n=1 Tax=Octopus sinensis TaxID=2607531 RepID=A0A6P7TDS0_9MOLL|nr:uncharacterized protein LOC115222996 [Octopus sinensis]
MRKKVKEMNKKAIIPILCLGTTISIFIIRSFNLNKENMQLIEMEINKGFLVDSKMCRIPNIDPFDISVRKYFSISKWRPCPGKASLTYQEDNVLRINKAVIIQRYKNNFHSCKVYPIVRNDTDDDHVDYLKESLLFKSDVNITDEFIRVQCFNRNNKTIYTNFHAFVQMKELRPKDTKPYNTGYDGIYSSKDSMKNIDFSNFAENKLSLNVLLIGIDSVSRLNFIRQMPLTRQFLLKHGAIEMLGYNKVGDNTFPNIIPFLTGKYLEELPESKKLEREPFDKYDIIWKHYNKSGYVTMFAEDSTSGAIFNHLRYGFKKQPTDHYLRPFALAREKAKSLWSNNNFCFGNRMEPAIVLQYTHDFIRVYKDKPYFTFTFITRISHDDMNMAGRGDFEYLRFLKKSFNQNLLNNTILFFFSDHGIRFGLFRKTYVGRLEERLPAMYILPPEWFRDKFPTLWNNLKVNTHRLTTPFDIYETLQDILDIEKTAERSKSNEIDYNNLKRISLFREIPLNRSCEAAHIKPHWCTCHLFNPLALNDSIVINVTNYLVNYINNMTSNSSKVCARLKLQEIKNAEISVMNDQVLSYLGKGVQTYKDYRIIMQTLPGEGLFEGTVRYYSDNEQFSLLGEISRINRYGHQSECVHDFILRKYCYCNK